MKLNNIAKKAVVAASFAGVGISAINMTNQSNHTVHAAVVSNDVSTYTVHKSTTVYNSYDSNRQATGQVLGANTEWKVIRTAYDNLGQKWYDLGKNQWVKVETAVKTDASVSESRAKLNEKQVSEQNRKFDQVKANYNKAVSDDQIAQTQQPKAENSQVAVSQAPQNNVNNYSQQAQTQTSTNYEQAVNTTNTAQTQAVSSPAPQTTSFNEVKTAYKQAMQNNSQSQNSTYTSNLSNSEASAKAWIANRESGNSYGARNGQFVGKYQLSASYLNGDYSASNQERVADNYVKGRYGSWSNAQKFWQANHWY